MDLIFTHYNAPINTKCLFQHALSQLLFKKHIDPSHRQPAPPIFPPTKTTISFRFILKPMISK